MLATRRQLLDVLHMRGVRAHRSLEPALADAARAASCALAARQLRRVRREFKRLDTTEKGSLALPDACAACRRLTGRLLSVAELRAVLRASGRDSPRDVRLSFDQLCSLVAELVAADHPPPDHGTQPLLYWKLAMFRAQQLLRLSLSSFIGIETINKTLKRFFTTIVYCLF